jgi:dipeptidyl aminopeptidase/acylaminoacyl peptidase
MNERDRELERRLRELRAPEEAEAEQRSRAVIRAAFAEREPVAPAGGPRRLILAAAAGVAALVIGLSPAGAKVGDLVEEMGDAVGLGEEDAKPALGSLPAAGELLVESGQGPWIVRDDGSKRLLGDYADATWSPRGLFVAVSEGRQLIAVEPDGEPRWTITAPARVSDPRWAPSGFRIAFRSGGDLWVVAADGIGGARRLDRNVAPIAPAWRPIGDSKLGAALAGANVLTYLERDREWVTVDVDTGERVKTTAADLEQLSASRSQGPVQRAVSPNGRTLASLRRVGQRTELALQRYAGDPQRRVLFAARGKLTGPTWSPDGRWLLVGWPEADQWLMIPVARSRGDGRRDRQDVVPYGRISEQFDPGGAGPAQFPRVSGWVLPER